MADHGWRDDVLGAPFERLELPLGEDSEGPVVATLVRLRRSPADLLLHAGGPLHGVDVLYVHGWSDYFFQVELAERLERLGARFHALDLRKYGRSLQPRQTPGFVDDLTTYDEDIAAALDAIAAEHRRGDTGRRLVPMGHSTGGLTLSLWAARHPEHVAGLVLNSPWLEFQANAVGRALVTPVIKLGARRNPLAPMPAVDPGFYTRTVSSAGEGSWTYDQQWRPDRGFPLHPGWLAAVFDGQATVEAGLGLEVPVLVMLSDKSMLQPRWDDGMARADVALNVDVVAHRALSLGSEVTVRRLHGALHDVVLSVPEVREHAYDAIARWASTLRH